MAEKKEEKKKVKVEDLKVHFIPKLLLGKSYVRSGLPLHTPHTVTEKFHTKERYQINENEIDIRSEKLKTLGPREKYTMHKTENQRYGWCQMKLSTLDRKDRRLHFAKQTDQMIKLYLITAERKNK